MLVFTPSEIRSSVDKLEWKQLELVLALLDNTDGSSTSPSSRALFIRELRRHIQHVLRVSYSIKGLN